MRMRCVGGLLVMLLAGCGGPGTQGSSAPVVILAAASTRDAVEEIADAFTREQGTEVRVSSGASSQLAVQIVHNAPADLFLSANLKWAEYVKKDGHEAESTVLLGNKLVLVVPQGNPAKIKGVEDLTGPEVKRVALAGPKVPAGVYAREALGKLGLLEGLEREKKIVAGEDVRVTLTYVERGEAEAGIVYATDARVSGKVEVVADLPEKTHTPIRYALVLLQEGAKEEGAVAFYRYMRSEKAAEVFRKHGFVALAE